MGQVKGQQTIDAADVQRPADGWRFADGGTGSGSRLRRLWSVSRSAQRESKGNPAKPQALPILGLRGGLGKTLLIAFLLLTIVPLSLLAFLTYDRIQSDTGQRVVASLETMVALKEAHLIDLVRSYERELIWLATTLEESDAGTSPGQQPYADGAQLAVLRAIDPTFTALVLVDLETEQVLATTDLAGVDIGSLRSLMTDEGGLAVGRSSAGPGSDPESAPLLAVTYSWDGGAGRLMLMGLMSWDSLQRVVTDSEGTGEGAVFYLVTQDGWMLSAGGLTSLAPQLNQLSWSPEPVPDNTRASNHERLPEARQSSPGGQTASATTASMVAALQGQGRLEAARDAGVYTDPAGDPVFSAYRWNPELQVAIVAQQPRLEALSTANTLTAVVVGATLAVALVTSALAAVVTRRVTRPIVQLTETAAWVARGDLKQRVMISRKDEIGVLARAFNRMASELGVLYENLEAKVAERTRQLAERTSQLEQANRDIHHYLMQLAISAEVARVAISIRDLGELLNTVVNLIGRAFELHHTSIYLLDDTGRIGETGEPYVVHPWAVWQSGSVAFQGKDGGTTSATSDGRQRSGSADVQRPAGTGISAGAQPPRARSQVVPQLVELVVAEGHRRVVCKASALDDADAQYPADTGANSGQSLADPEWIRPDVPVSGVLSELAVPLRIQDRILGVLALQSRRPNDFGEDAQVVYQSLADQISIAIENARAYAAERETVARLRELDRIQSEFLTNMSHALRTPLNSVIGFSRLMLKELDGPLNSMQRADLTDIHESGRQLLGLINDMLELSQLQLDVAPFSPGEVDLAEIIEGVMATTRALARGRSIQLHEEVPKNLPTLYTDGQRVRQVILALLSNAVKACLASPATARNSIHLRVSTEDGYVAISVKDTGQGFPRAERQRIFSNGDQGQGASGSQEDEGLSPAPGFGLAISKRVVEKLGGQIWLESEEGGGSTFTFTLPIRPATAPPAETCDEQSLRDFQGLRSETGDTGSEDQSTSTASGGRDLNRGNRDAL